jgi:FkbM family methyltransferase
MTWRTNRWVVVARNAGRTLGLNSWIASHIGRPGYEMKYDIGLASTMKQGDCVWDVGANIGHYTRLFSDRVGAKGMVFSFEPSSSNFSRLGSICADLENVKLLQVGLGREDGHLYFRQGADDLGATSRIVESGSGNVVVNIRSGVSLIRQGDASPPNVIKIDVEGFEYEVLVGFDRELEVSSLRAIGVEVHFGILKERGMAQAPQEIESLLHGYGFEISWPDSSHILAIRRAR